MRVVESAAIIAATCALVSGLGCIDENGDSVDWWAVFKFPNGAEYAYADPSNPLAISQHSLESASGNAVSDTLNQVITTRSESPQSAFWNDEHPDGTKVSVRRRRPSFPRDLTSFALTLSERLCPFERRSWIRWWRGVLVDSQRSSLA